MPPPPPPRPEPPLPSDCCGNGCSPCVWESYEDALAAWEQACAAAEKPASEPPEAGA